MGIFLIYLDRKRKKDMKCGLEGLAKAKGARLTTSGVTEAPKALLVTPDVIAENENGAYTALEYLELP